MKTTIACTLLLMLLCSFRLSAQWRWMNPQPQANSLSSVYYIDKNTAVSVGACGTILKTTNGGDRWTVQASGTIRDLNAVFFLDSKSVGRSVIPVSFSRRRTAEPPGQP